MNDTQTASWSVRHNFLNGQQTNQPTDRPTNRPGHRKVTLQIILTFLLDLRSVIISYTNQFMYVQIFMNILDSKTNTNMFNVKTPLRDSVLNIHMQI